MNDKSPLSRREFLKSAARLAVGAVLAGGVAGLLFSRKKPLSPSFDASQHRCRSGGYCRTCPLGKDCLHPNALSYKRKNI